MTEAEALRIAFELFVDVTDGRPTPEEAEAANIIKAMWKARQPSDKPAKGIRT